LVTKNSTVNPLDIQQTYLENKKIIKILAEKYDFPVYFFIQPVPVYRNKHLNHMFMPNGKAEEFKRMIIPKMPVLEETVDNKTSFSLTSLLEKYNKQPFVDNIHYTADVCRLIAVNIGNKITIPEI
jgi:hypothetical protein